MQQAGVHFSSVVCRTRRPDDAHELAVGDERHVTDRVRRLLAGLRMRESLISSIELPMRRGRPPAPVPGEEALLEETEQEVEA